jgi:hypothetical protein
MNRGALMVVVGVLAGLLAMTAWRHLHEGTGGASIAGAASVTNATPLRAANEKPQAPPAGSKDDSATRGMGTPPAPPTKLVVAFRMDPSITRGLYLGDRWVSPPNFAFSQEGKRYVVRARAQLVDGSTGKRVDLDSAEWSTDDPKLVGITPGDNGEVEIAVDRPGTAQLRVKAGGEVKIVQVASKQFPDAMDVAFRQ